MTNQEQLESFYRFATNQIAAGATGTSIDELYDRWRIEHPSSNELEANVAAVEAALDDMEAGDTGRDAHLLVRELRGEFNRDS